MALPSQTATLIAAGIAAIASLLSLFLNSRLVARREKRQQVWQLELKRITELEELAGRVTETFCAYYPIEKLEVEAALLLPQLEVGAGRFRRYKEITQAIRDIHNAAGRVLDDRRHHEIDRESKHDLESSFQKLLKSCDAIIKDRRA
jgi:hypothetical protein